MPCPWAPAFAGATAVRGGLRFRFSPGMTGVVCGSAPRTWVPVCAGKTEGGVGDYGGLVGFGV